jgi:anti-sigma factor RsiW
MAREKLPTGSHHRHSKAGCLKILRRLSAYLDDELTADVCGEVRDHMGICPRCVQFFESLRRTVSLCREVDAPPLSPTQKAKLRRAIHRALDEAER